MCRTPSSNAIIFSLRDTLPISSFVTACFSFPFPGLLFCSPSKNLLCSLYILYLGNPTWSTCAGHAQTHIQPDTPGCQPDLSKWVPNGNFKLSWPWGVFPLTRPYLFLISVNGTTIHQHVCDRRKEVPSACVVRFYASYICSCYSFFLGDPSSFFPILFPGNLLFILKKSVPASSAPGRAKHIILWA